MPNKHIILSPLEIYEAFQESMLAGTDYWKKLVAETPLFIAPSVRIENRKDFIKVNENWFDSIEKQEVKKIAVCDHLVIAHLSITMETKNKKQVILEVVEWYTTNNGKIEAIELFTDTSLLKKANHLPPSFNL